MSARSSSRTVGEDGVLSAPGLLQTSYVDCSSYPEAQRPACSAAKSTFANAEEPSQCDNPEVIIECTLDPSNLCNCKQ